MVVGIRIAGKGAMCGSICFIVTVTICNAVALLLAYRLVARGDSGGSTGITADDFFVTDQLDRDHHGPVRHRVPTAAGGLIGPTGCSPSGSPAASGPGSRPSPTCWSAEGAN